MSSVYVALLNAATNPIFLLDQECRIHFANSATLKAIEGLIDRPATSEEVLGRTMADLEIPDWFLIPFRARLQRAFGGERVVAEALFPFADGTMRTYEYALTPLGDVGSVPLIACHARDTETVHLGARSRQDILQVERRARVEAEAAVHVRDDFLSTAAHDLKTPLTAAQGRAQLLMRQIRRGGEPNIERIKSNVMAIQAAITQMATQIDELQDVAFLQIGRPLKLNRKPNDFVEAVKAAAARMTRPEGATLDVDVSTPPEPMMANFDKIRIDRVLDNLLSNAIKYSGQHKVIVIRAHQENHASGPRIVLSVSDNGIGVPEAELSRIFERYHRASNVGEISGAGVGLSGARQIVHQHGGDLTATSIEGEGSTFTMWLPVDAPEDE